MLPTRTLPGGHATRASLPLGPNNLPLCRWCDLEILAKRRRTFCSDYCVHQWRLRTDPGYLRDQVFARDRGICAVCRIDTIAAYNALKRARGPARAAGLRLYGMKSITTRRSLWDADHIRPVAEGGGQCDLENLRTLCLLCHREATAQLRTRLTQARESNPLQVNSDSEPALSLSKGERSAHSLVAPVKSTLTKFAGPAG